MKEVFHMQYVCLDCYKLFEEPQHYYEDFEHFGNLGRQEFDACPFCGGTYQKAFKCDMCNNYIQDRYIEIIDGTFVCFDCYTIRDL